MKAVILAGGLGTRISEESVSRPKPMIEIGGKPILWHIMKIYSHYGINNFIVCCGYKGYVIKEYFANYFLHTSDVTFDMQNNSMEVHQRFAEPAVSEDCHLPFGNRHGDDVPLIIKEPVACDVFGRRIRRGSIDAEIRRVLVGEPCHPPVDFVPGQRLDPQKPAV